MNVRQTSEKSFGAVKTSKAIIYYGVPLCIQVRGATTEEFMENLKELGEKQKLISNADSSNLDVTKFVDIAKKMYPNINPTTKEQDVKGDEFYAELIPKVIMGGIITPQTTEDGTQLFNGNGTVSVAEVLDGLNAIEFGSNASENRQKSIDNVSDVDDFFNEGYNRMCWGYSSPFYNLYARSELMIPITRLELAYLLVCCSDTFDVKMRTKNVGVSFNWLNPFSYVKSFNDWSSYKIGLLKHIDSDLPEFDIHAYMGDRSVTELLNDIKVGKSAIPFPMIMSLIDLFVQDIFYNEDNNLYPLRQVSRGELCYCLTRVSKKGGSFYGK